MFHTSVNSKSILMFGAFAISAVILVFAAPGNQKALAANLAGSGLIGTDPGISYPSPLSHYFGGDVLHHHYHGGSHYYYHGFHYHGSDFHYHHGGHHHR